MTIRTIIIAIVFFIPMSAGAEVTTVDCVAVYDSLGDRVGRTARAGASGDAISFGCETYAISLPDIESYIGHKIPVASYNPDDLPVLKKPPYSKSKNSRNQNRRPSGNRGGSRPRPRH